MAKNKIGEIKVYTLEAQTYVIPEVREPPKRVIRLEITSTHKYNNISSTKIVNHATTFKNAPKCFSS